VGAVLHTRLGKERIVRAVKPAARALRDVFAEPRRAAVLLVAAVGITGGYVVALTSALHAFGVHPPLLTVAGAYLAGAAIASVSPTPGGLGAMEAALVAGLTRLGVVAGPAIAGVLAFRLVTYWLPLVPGAVAVRALRRRHAL
jgi:uncharacterized protein (TIRG00374 family)